MWRGGFSPGSAVPGMCTHNCQQQRPADSAVVAPLPASSFDSPLQSALQAWGWAPRKTQGNRLDQLDNIEALLRQLHASHTSIAEELQSQRVQMGALEAMKHEQQLMRGDIQAIGKALAARWPLKGKDLRV